MCKWVWSTGPEFICVSSVLKLVISGAQAHTHARILMSLACRLIEIWAWIIHAWLMSLGNLLTLNSRLVGLNLGCVKCVCCIVAEVKAEINNQYRCWSGRIRSLSSLADLDVWCSPAGDAAMHCFWMQVKTKSRPSTGTIMSLDLESEQLRSSLAVP